MVDVSTLNNTSEPPFRSITNENKLLSVIETFLENPNEVNLKVAFDNMQVVKHAPLSAPGGNHGKVGQNMQALYKELERQIEEKAPVLKIAREKYADYKKIEDFLGNTPAEPAEFFSNLTSGENTHLEMLTEMNNLLKLAEQSAESSGFVKGGAAGSGIEREATMKALFRAWFDRLIETCESDGVWSHQTQALNRWNALRPETKAVLTDGNEELIKELDQLFLVQNYLAKSINPSGIGV